MTSIDSDILTRQISVTESLVKTGEVRHPFAPIISMMSEIVTKAVAEQPDIKRNTLWQKLLDNTEIDSVIKQHDPFSYGSMPFMAANSVLGLICDLDKIFLGKVSSILDGQELNTLKELSKRIVLANINYANDLSLILSVANISIPTLILDEEYVKNYRQPKPEITTGGEDYGPATGYLGVNKWAVDFRQFKDEPELVNQLLKL